MPPMNESTPITVHFGRQALGASTLDDDEKEFIDTFFEMPWFIDTVSAFVILHWGEVLRNGHLSQVTEEVMVWADESELFHKELLPRVRRAFLTVVVVAAARLIRFQEEHL